MEEQDGRRRRQQEKISILCWFVRARNSLPPSSSRSFRTQSHWSYTAGQCVHSEQFLRLHLSYWMCGQFALHHKFRIDTGRTKFQQGQTDGILFSRWIPRKRIIKTQLELDLAKPRLASYKQKWKVHQNTVYWDDFQLAQRKGLKFFQTRSNAVILYDTLPAFCISKAIVMKSEEIHISESVWVTSTTADDFLIKIIGRVIWILMLQEAVKTSNESN